MLFRSIPKTGEQLPIPKHRFRWIWRLDSLVPLSKPPNLRPPFPSPTLPPMNEPQLPAPAAPSDPMASPGGSVNPPNAPAPSGEFELALCSAIEHAIHRGLAPGELLGNWRVGPEADRTSDAAQTEIPGQVQTPDAGDTRASELPALLNPPKPLAAMEALLAHPAIAARRRSFANGSGKDRKSTRLNSSHT